VANFVYSLLLPSLFGFLAASQGWFAHLRPWVDFNYAQSALFNGSLSAAQWAHVAVTGLLWLIVPLGAGLALMMRSEVK
jgi:hypothetical protein